MNTSPPDSPSVLRHHPPKVVLGLGNPGAEYHVTRHNAGWWLLDRIARDRGFDPFRREGVAEVARGTLAGSGVTLVRPLTWMNRSGLALEPWLADPDFDPSRDLMVLVDDATRPVGGVRFRPRGSHGGHNGLRSLQAAIGHRDFPRLRIAVGVAPPGEDLARWVLSPLPAEEEAQVVGLLPGLVEGVEQWVAEGTEAAMNAHNR